MAKVLTTPVLTTREREAKYGQVWRRLQRRLLGSDADSKCKLGDERQDGRHAKCSACTVKLDLENPDLEIDHSIAELISDKIIVCPSHCPYRVFASALIEALLLGPGAEETARESERTRIIELKTALTHIDRALKTLSPRREDIKYLAVRSDEELFGRLADVVTAERLITDAVNFLIENAKRNHAEETDLTKPTGPKRGIRGFLDIRGVVSACDSAWKVLIGEKAGKRDANFHRLLHLAAETILGPLDPEPDWEWQIVAARKRERGWKSEQKNQD
jgi:hypothetical protein